MRKKVKNILLLGTVFCSLATTLALGGLKEKFAFVKADDNQYFVSDSNLSIVDNATDTKGQKGVDVVLSGVKGQDYASFEYLNYIDTDTLKDGFLTFSMKPETVGANDFEYMLVTLTDALDESSQLVWAFGMQPKSSWWPNYVSAWAAFSDNLERDMEPGYGNSATLKHKDSYQRAVAINTFIYSVSPLYTGYYQDCGYLIGEKSSYFIQSNETTQLSTLKFAYNDMKMKVNDRVFAEFTDTRFFDAATEKIKGTVYEDLYTVEHAENLFSSGYAKLKIAYMDIKSDTVTCNIGEIGGQKFSDNDGCSVEATSPLLIADYATNGVVGFEYQIPQATAKDLIDGDLSDGITVKVTAPSGKNVAISDNAFTMEEEGTYTITYSVINKRGNVFEKDYKFVCYRDVPLTEFGNGMNVKSEYVVGDSVMLLNTLGKNGLSTEIDQSVLLETVVQIDGKVEDVLKDVDSKLYTFEKEGSYAVVFRYRNAFGSVDSQFSRFNVVRAIRIIPESVPLSLQANKLVAFDDFEVENHVNEVKEEDVYRAVYVNDTLIYMAKGDEVISGSLSMAPTVLTQTGLAKLEYKAGFSKDNLPFVQKYEIPVIAPKYFSDYILSYDADGTYSRQGVTVSDTELGAVFTTDRDKYFGMPQPIVDKKTTIKFGIAAASQYDVFRVVLSDYGTEEKKLTFDLVKSGNNTFNLTVNGKTTTITSGLADGILQFGWYFDSNSRLLKNDLKEVLTAPIETWDDGTVFKGFSEGVFTLKFGFVGVREMATFRIEQLANQNFGSMTDGEKIFECTDTQAPQIAFIDSMATQVIEFGQTILVGAAKAYDILDSETKVTVSVQDPNGDYILRDVSCDESRKIQADIYGKYLVTYTAVDSVGIFRTRQMFTITVIDNDEPIITVFGELPAEVVAGSTITLPKAVAVDNVDGDLECWIIAVYPDGKRCVVNARYNAELKSEEMIDDATFTFTEKGEFRIIYYAVDGFYNYIEKEYVIIAK